MKIVYRKWNRKERKNLSGELNNWEWMQASILFSGRDECRKLIFKQVIFNYNTSCQWLNILLIKLNLILGSNRVLSVKCSMSSNLTNHISHLWSRSTSIVQGNLMFFYEVILFKPNNVYGKSKQIWAWIHASNTLLPLHKVCTFRNSPKPIRTYIFCTYAGLATCRNWNQAPITFMIWFILYKWYF